MKAFAAYNKRLEFLSLASIGISPHSPMAWIDRTYVSGKKEFEIVPIEIRFKRASKSKRRRKSK